MKTKVVNVYGVDYTIREATRGELEYALSLETSEESEDYLVETCVVSPKINPQEVLAGIPAALAEKILDFSGATAEASAALQQAAEERVLTPAGKIEALMMGVLHLKPADIKNMTPEEWHNTAAAAQLIAVTMYPEFDIQRYMSIGAEQQQAKTNPVERLIRKLPPVARR